MMGILCTECLILFRFNYAQSLQMTHNKGTQTLAVIQFWVTQIENASKILN